MSENDGMLSVHVDTIGPIHTVMLKRYGPYEGISEAFDKLFQWVEANNVRVGRTIGVYWDNPEFTDAELLRSAAAVEVPAGFVMPERGDLRLVTEDIPGGTYATARYVGPYENLEAAWTELTNTVEQRLQREIAPHIGAFEVYVNDAETTAPSQLITELYMPLA